MSFDLITPELDNHPIIRTMHNMHCAWSIGCVQTMFEVPVLFRLSYVGLLLRCAMHKGSGAPYAPVRG